MNSNKDSTLYLKELAGIAARDVAKLNHAQKSYGNSWKKRGGIGAYMMLARKIDRMEVQVESNGFDIFNAILGDKRPEGIIDDIRDLRQYLMLVEAEVSALGFQAKVMNCSPGEPTLEKLDEVAEPDEIALVEPDLVEEYLEEEDLQEEDLQEEDLQEDSVTHGLMGFPISEALSNKLEHNYPGGVMAHEAKFRIDYMKDQQRMPKGSRVAKLFGHEIDNNLGLVLRRQFWTVR